MKEGSSEMKKGETFTYANCEAHDNDECEIICRESGKFDSVLKKNAFDQLFNFICKIWKKFLEFICKFFHKIFLF